MDGSTTVRLKPHEIALLRGGPRAAVTVSVLDLHLRGAVEAGQPGTMRTSGAPTEGEALPPLTKAVHAALFRRADLRELLQRPGVKRALAELRTDLLVAGLLRSLPPHRTRTARRTLKALHGEHPVPVSRKDLPTADALIAVALHGDPALKVLAPRFALRAGLTARAEVADNGLLPHSWGGGGGGFSCGGGGGPD